MGLVSSCVLCVVLQWMDENQLACPHLCRKYWDTLFRSFAVDWLHVAVGIAVARSISASSYTLQPSRHGCYIGIHSLLGSSAQPGPVSYSAPIDEHCSSSRSPLTAPTTFFCVVVCPISKPSLPRPCTSQHLPALPSSRRICNHFPARSTSPRHDCNPRRDHL